VPVVSPQRHRAKRAPNSEQTVDYVVNAWDMEDPGLSSGNQRCNNLCFDGHADWLHMDENTPRYWCGVQQP